MAKKRHQIIQLKFSCGCEGQASGTEKLPPRCKTHNAPIRRVVAPRPQVRGPVSSPLKVD